MTRTQKAFIWVSAVGLTLFALAAAIIGAEIRHELPNRGTDERFFMLIWLAAALLIFSYYLVRGVYTNTPPTGRQMFLSAYLAAVYAAVVAGLAYMLS